MLSVIVFSSCCVRIYHDDNNVLSMLLLQIEWKPALRNWESRERESGEQLLQQNNTGCILALARAVHQKVLKVRRSREFQLVFKILRNSLECSAFWRNEKRPNQYLVASHCIYKYILFYFKFSKLKRFLNNSLSSLVFYLLVVFFFVCEHSLTIVLYNLNPFFVYTFCFVSREHIKNFVNLTTR